MKAYTIAVTASIGAAVTLRKLSNVMLKGASGGLATFATYCINYCAVALSSYANVVFVRRGEMTTGATVFDE